MTTTVTAESQAPDADALHQRGLAAHREGRAAEAIALIERAIAARPTVAAYHANLGSILSGLGRYEQATAAYRRATGLEPSYALAHANLGYALGRLGALDEAVAACRAAIELAPDMALAHGNLGWLLRMRGESDAAADACRRALALKPGWPRVLANLGGALLDQGRHDEAIAAFDAAARGDPQGAEHHYNLGLGLIARGDHPAALASCRRALAIEPDNLDYLFMASALERRLGRDTQHRGALEREIRRRPHRTSRAAGAPLADLLVVKSLDNSSLELATGGRGRALGGNLMTDNLIGAARFTTTTFYMLSDNLSTAAVLPAHDVIVNAIADADLERDALRALSQFLSSRDPVPLVNHPDNVGRTTRDGTYARLADIDGVVVPKTIRLGVSRGGDETVAERIRESGLRYPVLLRKPGRHHGGTMVKADDNRAVSEFARRADADEIYVTQYVESRLDSGYWRKLRVFLVDGSIYPKHCYIDDRWMIHGGSRTRTMVHHPWMIDDECRFLTDWRGYVGDRAATGIERLRDRVGLDFCGIDFAPLADGTALIFEVNPAMAHTLTSPADAAAMSRLPSYLEVVSRAFEAISRAFEQMLVGKAEGGR